YAVLREAIAKTGKVALARVVISQRERTVALRALDDGGIMAHTLYEERDINSAKDLFDDLAGVKTDPQMVGLASQLIGRQSGQFAPADLEDRYETRLRAMIDAKLKGESVDVEADITPPRDTNVVDLMTVLKQSLGQTPAHEGVPQPKKKAAKEPARK